MTKKLKQLSSDDLYKLRKELYDAQNGVCPILKIKMPFEHSVVDHQHMTSSETIGENGAGLVRGIIHRQANSLEGRYTNAFRRFGMHKLGITLPEFLRNLADYLERDNLPFIHPNEKPKTKKLKKISYNKLKKLATGKKKFPVYPKSKKLTKELEALYIEYGLDPEFYE